MSNAPIWGLFGELYLAHSGADSEAPRTSFQEQQLKFYHQIQQK